MILERILAQRLELSAPWPDEPDECLASACGETPLGHCPVVSLWVEAAGVLYDDTHWWRWLAQLINHVGVHVGHDDLQQAWECEFLRDAGRGCEDVWHALRRCLMQLGLSTAYCDEVRASAAARLKLLDHATHPLPGSRRALAELSQRGVSLVALASVGNSAAQLADRLQSLALSAPFQRFVGASNGDFPPTTQQYYLELATSLGIPPCETAVASNKPHHLAAARAAGLNTIAIGCDQQTQVDIHLDLFASLPRKLSAGHARTLAA